jgi:hypothetical protein
LEELAARLEVVSEEIGAMVVEAEFVADDLAVVTCDAFFRLAKHLRPKVIYANIEKFDARREVDLRISGVEDMMEQRGLEEDQRAVKGIRKLLDGLVSRWSRRDGELYRVVLSLVHEGIFHEAGQRIDWEESFAKDVDETETRLDEFVEEIVERRESEQEKETIGKIAACVAALKGDERFTKGRTNKAKRLLLASTMFPDLQNAVLNAVIRQAEAELWLANPDRG